MRQQPSSAFRCIVCGIDFSRHSAMALRYAAALARDGRTRVKIVFAIDPFLTAAAASAYDLGALKSAALLELRKFVVRTLGRDGTSLVSCEVGMGKPARVIVSAAERLGADLLVVGTHGLSGARKAFFGSTSEAVLRRTKRPLLAVPRRCGPPRPTWPQGGIVAPIHVDDHAAQDASAVAEMARSFGVPLDVVVTVPALRVPLWLRLQEHSTNHEGVAAAQAWLNRRLDDRAPGYKTDTHVLVGDTADDITRFAAARGADMLIVTIPASRGIRRLIGGSTAYRLLCSARCPVLVLPRLERGSHSRKPHPHLHDAA